ncbi:hypothetical protein IFM89_011119, partial [Coptis chinensis]
GRDVKKDNLSPLETSEIVGFRKAESSDSVTNNGSPPRKVHHAEWAIFPYGTIDLLWKDILECATLEECMYKIPVDASAGISMARTMVRKGGKRTLDSADKVVVNIGTGYFIEKTMDEGKEYCEHKMNLMKSNYDQLIEVASKKKNIGDEAREPSCEGKVEV